MRNFKCQRCVIGEWRVKVFSIIDFSSDDAEHHGTVLFYTCIFNFSSSTYIYPTTALLQLSVCKLQQKQKIKNHFHSINFNFCGWKKRKSSQTYSFGKVYMNFPGKFKFPFKYSIWKIRFSGVVSSYAAFDYAVISTQVKIGILCSATFYDVLYMWAKFALTKECSMVFSRWANVGFSELIYSHGK